MKGFPYHKGTAMKQKPYIGKGQDRANVGEQAGTEFQDPDMGGMPYNSALKQVEGMEEPTQPDTSWDTDGDGMMNDKERLAFLKSLGLTEKEVNDELNRLAEEDPYWEDYDQDAYISTAKALAKKKKEGEGSAIERLPKTPMEYGGDLPRTKTGRTAGGY